MPWQDSRKHLHIKGMLKWIWEKLATKMWVRVREINKEW